VSGIKAYDKQKSTVSTVPGRLGLDFSSDFGEDFYNGYHEFGSDFGPDFCVSDPDFGYDITVSRNVDAVSGSGDFYHSDFGSDFCTAEEVDAVVTVSGNASITVVES